MEPYRFLSDEEPTDEQLKILMHEVAVEAKLRADISNKIFWEKLHETVKATQEAYSSTIQDQ